MNPQNVASPQRHMDTHAVSNGATSPSPSTCSSSSGLAQGERWRRAFGRDTSNELRQWMAQQQQHETSSSPSTASNGGNTSSSVGGQLGGGGRPSTTQSSTSSSSSMRIESIIASPYRTQLESCESSSSNNNNNAAEYVTATPLGPPMNAPRLPSLPRRHAPHQRSASPLRHHSFADFIPPALQSQQQQQQQQARHQDAEVSPHQPPLIKTEKASSSGLDGDLTPLPFRRTTSSLTQYNQFFSSSSSSLSQQGQSVELMSTGTGVGVGGGGGTDDVLTASSSLGGMIGGGSSTSFSRGEGGDSINVVPESNNLTTSTPTCIAAQQDNIQVQEKHQEGKLHREQQPHQVDAVSSSCTSSSTVSPKNHSHSKKQPAPSQHYDFRSPRALQPKHTSSTDVHHNSNNNNNKGTSFARNHVVVRHTSNDSSSSSSSHVRQHDDDNDEESSHSNNNHNKSHHHQYQQQQQLQCQSLREDRSVHRHVFSDDEHEGGGRGEEDEGGEDDALAMASVSLYRRSSRSSIRPSTAL